VLDKLKWGLSVKPTVQPGTVEEAIEQALKRDAKIDAERISVTAGDGKVTLSGNMRSWAARDEVR